MWADAEAMTLAHLRDTLPPLLEASGDYDPVTLSTTAPEEPPSRLVRVMLSGSERRTVVHRDSKITLKCWSNQGEAEASRLMEHVYAAIDAWDLVPHLEAGHPALTSNPTRRPAPRDTSPHAWFATEQRTNPCRPCSTP